MRLVIGFIFFGILFYAIYLYFPDAFQTMVSWDAKIFDWVREVIEKITGKTNPPHDPTAPEPPKVLMDLLRAWL